MKNEEKHLQSMCYGLNTEKHLLLHANSLMGDIKIFEGFCGKRFFLWMFQDLFIIILSELRLRTLTKFYFLKKSNYNSLYHVHPIL